MATNKIHFLGTMLFPKVCSFKGLEERFFSATAAAEVIINDSVRCWVGPREFTHFTLNPETGGVSYIFFPELSIKYWTKEMIQEMPKESFGKPGNAVIDEATVPEVFWLFNMPSEQNTHLYMHLIQDKTYDRFVRSVIDTSRRYEDIYVFDGVEMTGAQLRGQGMEKWSKGLLTELDDQFYVRLAKRYFEATGIKADRKWLDEVMKTAVWDRYPEDLAAATVKFISLSDKANTIIESGDFDSECWPVPNKVVDQYVDWMLEDIYDALWRTCSIS